MGFKSWFNCIVLKKEEVVKRARTTSGTFKADNPATKGKNEAYTTTYKKKKTKKK